MLTEELRIEIKAQAQQAVNELKKTGVATDDLVNKFTKMTTALLGSAGVIAATKKLYSVLKDASDVAAVQESAVTRLNAALEITGQETGGVSESMQDFAAQLQKVTVVGDEVSIGLMQTAINMGLTSDQAKVATQQAIALSRAYGIDLNTAMIGVVNTIQGQTSTLTRYIPSLKAATDATERMSILNEEATKAWAVATAEVNTAAGAQQQLENAIGDLKETAGSFINETLTPWRQKLLEIVQETNNAWDAQFRLKDAIAAERDGSATLDQQLAILIDRRARYTGATQRQKDALDAEIQALQRQIGIRDSNIARMRTETDERRRSEETARTAADEAAQAAIDSANRRLAAQAAENQIAREAYDMETENARALAEYHDSLREAKKAADKEAHDQRMAEIQSELSFYSSYASNVGTIFANLISSMTAGDEELSDKKKKQIIAIFNMQKIANIAQITMDTAAAVMKTYAQLGGIKGAIAAAAVAGVGATQLAIAASAKPPVQLAEGGIVPKTPGGISAIIGEGNYDEAVIPLKPGMSMGNITVNVYGAVGSREEVAAWVYEGINRAKQTGAIAA